MNAQKNITTMPSPYELYIELAALYKTIATTTNVTHSKILSNVLIALELSLQLVANANEDQRRYLNKNHKLERLAENLILQFNLFADLLPYIDAEVFQKKLLQETFDNLSALTFLPEKLYLKINAQITSSIRTHVSQFNFNKLLYALNEANKSHNEEIEDFFFCVIHQITECWLNSYMILSEKFNENLARKNYSFAFDIGWLLVKIIDFITQHIQLLDLMIINDYHSLRVKLRDASGAQSKQAHNAGKFIVTSFKQQQVILIQQDITLVDIIYKPELFSDLYQIITIFQKLAKAYQAFLFKHYTLASNILGQNTFGSLGYEVNGLIAHFTKPLLPEIDQALYDVSIITNFKYSENSGILIKKREETIIKDIYNCLIKPEKLNKKILEEKTQLYFLEHEHKNKDRWLQLFDENNCVFHDHLSSKPYVGLTKIKNYITSLWAAIDQINFTVNKKYFFKNSVSFSWKATAFMYNGKKIFLSGVEKLYFNKKYKIVRAESTVDTEKITKQLYNRYQYINNASYYNLKERS